MTEPFVPGTVKPEELYEELNDLGRELGIPVPQTHVGLEVHDAEGNLLSEYKDRSRTYTRQFWNFYFGALSNAPTTGGTFGEGSLKYKRANGTEYDTDFSSTGYAYIPWIANANTTPSTQGGIAVGTSTAAENFNDHTLGALIAHGTGAGQLSHITGNATAGVTYDAPSKTMFVTSTRQFLNSSGNSITVNETGAYAYQNGDSTVIMVCRDKLATGVVVPNTGYLTVTYVFSLVFPQ